jgi:hypothetical protein
MQLDPINPLSPLRNILSRAILYTMGGWLIQMRINMGIIYGNWTSNMLYIIYRLWWVYEIISDEDIIFN